VRNIIPALASRLNSRCPAPGETPASLKIFLKWNDSSGCLKSKERIERRVLPKRASKMPIFSFIALILRTIVFKLDTNVNTYLKNLATVVIFRLIFRYSSAAPRKQNRSLGRSQGISANGKGDQFSPRNAFITPGI